MEKQKGSYTEEFTVFPEQGKHRQRMRLLRGREKPAAPRCPPAGAGTGCSVRGTLFPHGPGRVWRRSLSLCIRQSWVISNGFAITFACMLPPPRASLLVSLRAAAVAG